MKKTPLDRLNEARSKTHFDTSDLKIVNLPPYVKNEQGKVYGRLTVSSYAGSGKQFGYKNNGAWWYCHCSCGSATVVSGSDLRRSMVESCGCIHIERTIRDNITHKWNTGKKRQK